jgi:hypothetical protein
VPSRPSRPDDPNQLASFGWYKGTLSREAAERMLGSSKEATFLLRSSSRAPEPVVSFVHNGTMQHCTCICACASECV